MVEWRVQQNFSVKVIGLRAAMAPPTQPAKSDNRRIMPEYGGRFDPWLGYMSHDYGWDDIDFSLGNLTGSGSTTTGPETLAWQPNLSPVI